MSSSQASSSQETCETCGICRAVTGEGQAIFTSQCSHSFHYPCIANNVQYGNLCCPICLTKWDKNNVPFQVPPLQQNMFNANQLFQPHPQEPSFADDEPLQSSSATPSPGQENITIKTHAEFSALPAAQTRPEFPVLVRIRAPVLQDLEGEGRTPVDLVTVLDVSGSMDGNKISLLKRAVKFVIENLGPSDRLSIVSFQSKAERVLPLRRMTEEGRESAILAAESLIADGGTDIAKGLKKGVQVLEERRERNPVCSIILLSDGQDNYSHTKDRMLKKLPDSIKSNDMEHQIPVHTFGFGNDHDANIMHAISDASGGTFSYIESVGRIQDAFALCIGGLLSVVVQELRLTVMPVSPEVKIVSIPSGRHGHQISPEGREGIVDVGNMYAEEEKQFLVYLSVPPSSASNANASLLDVLCAYKDPASEQVKQVRGERVEIKRPQFCDPAEMTVSLEVDRQRNRILVAEAIAEAQRLAEMGNLEAARAVLTQRRETLLTSAAAKAGDNVSKLFEKELKEIMDKMESMNLYQESGRAFALAGMSAHAGQRASARGNASMSCLAPRKQLSCNLGRGAGGGISCSAEDEDESDEDMEMSLCDDDGGYEAAVAFETPAMVRMVQKSKMMNTEDLDESTVHKPQKMNTGKAADQ